MFKPGYPNTLWACGLALLVSVAFHGPNAQTIAEGSACALSVSDLQSPSIIRVSTNLVMVPVSVTDAAGRAVRNLEKDDFQITEDGNLQDISRMAEASQSPLQLALLFDLSGSVNNRFEFELQAATRFLKKVWKPDDAVT